MGLTILRTRITPSHLSYIHLHSSSSTATFELTHNVTWGPFLERPGNLKGQKSDFEIKISRLKVGRVLTSNKVHFVQL